ncbi:hypothetical protein ACLOJK_024515 [Asimina triloba]
MEREGETNNSRRRFFVAVHVGAGYHAPASEQPLGRAMKRACRAAAAILRAVISLLSHLSLSDCFICGRLNVELNRIAITYLQHRVYCLRTISKAEILLVTVEMMNDSGGCIDAVAAAIQVLEDDPSTNAGRGSNLTEDGHVEGDASIMDCSGVFGSVGAVPGSCYGEAGLTGAVVRPAPKTYF